jgi:prevent-host-death family protein
MRSIGIRELRQNASRYLRLVREGESIEVTDRGEPIAMITPIPKKESVLERLRREGRLIGPEEPGSIFDLEPVELPPGTKPLSEQIIEARAEERY